MTTFNAADHPRTHDGKFATKPQSETSGVDLTAALPMSEADIEWLQANRGVFEEGYDEWDSASVLSGFETARLEVVWDYIDDDGAGGDSTFIGYPIGGDRNPFAAHRDIHPDVMEVLIDPDSDVDVRSIPSLLDDDSPIVDVEEFHELGVPQGRQWARYVRY